MASYTQKPPVKLLILQKRAFSFYEILALLYHLLIPFTSSRVETLHLRLERHSENALKVAKFLEQHELVDWVHYAGLPSHPSYSLAQKYLPKGQGAILTFGVRGGKTLRLS